MKMKAFLYGIAKRMEKDRGSGDCLAHILNNEDKKAKLRHFTKTSSWKNTLEKRLTHGFDRSDGFLIPGTYKKRPGAYADLAPMGAF